MSERNIQWKETGEIRPPNMGEWFRGSRGQFEQARFDFTATSHPIMAMVVTEKRECKGFLIDDADPDSWSGCDTKDGTLTDCPSCHGDGYVWKPMEEPNDRIVPESGK